MATHQVIRTITSRGHQYRQRVELYYDPKRKQTRARIVENLGPVNPVYRRTGPLAPRPLPMERAHFGLLATRIMMGSLTAAQVLETVREMGEEIPPGDLAAVGIRFDLGEKTLELLLWPRPPSVSHPGVSPAGKLPRSKVRTPRRSSRSKAPGG